MANLKISQLTTYTGTAADQRVFVMNNIGETETFKFSGYTSPFRYVTGTARIQNEYDTTVKVASDYQINIGGETNDIDATGSPYTNIFGGNNNTITTKHNNKGYGTVIIGGSNNIIGGSSDSIANYLPIIAGGTTNENNGYSTGIFASRDSIIRYGADTNNGIQMAVILGGWYNTISGLALESGILAGYLNTIQQYRSAIIAGESNQMLDSGGSVGSAYRHSIIAGGLSNTMTQSNRSSIIGGSGNTMTTKVNSHMIGTNGRTADTNDCTFVENLKLFNYASLNFADDTAAAGGVVLGQVYHNAGALRIRIV